MFQDPTSADDIAAEQEAESQAASEAGEIPETTGAQEAWLGDDAWPAPKDSRRRWKRDPWPAEEQPVEETQLLEQHWPQEEPEQEESATPDWTSADTPWPGETRRPAEPTWAAEPPVAESQPTPQWGDEPWQQEVRPPAEEPAAEQAWTHREPAAEHPVTDPWGQERYDRPEPERPVREPWALDPNRFAPDVPPEDPWVRAKISEAELPREVEVIREPVPPAVEPPPSPSERDPAAHRPQPNGRQIFVDDDEDWKPLSIDLNLEEDKPSLDPIAEAAARLKAAETAIKVENGLAYVLVDDEGRPVLR